MCTHNSGPSTNEHEPVFEKRENLGVSQTGDLGMLCDAMPNLIHGDFEMGMEMEMVVTMRWWRGWSRFKKFLMIFCVCVCGLYTVVFEARLQIRRSTEISLPLIFPPRVDLPYPNTKGEPEEWYSK